MSTLQNQNSPVSTGDVDKKSWLESHEAGYHKTLGNRQVQMIAIGGAIGTGLFLGAGARLQIAGPSLAVVYLVCGVFSFLILRALGELVMHRPSSGSFVSYAREFLGEKASYVAGWMYFLNWAMTGIVDITAVALYMHYWAAFSSVPQWIFALIALCIVAAMNLIGVKWFAEMEFWFALIKVAAISLFLVIGSIILGTGVHVGGHSTGVHLISENGGLFPHGLLPALVLVQGVVFAFAGVELVGTAAGECKDARKVLPRAINSVIWRIAVFYVGAVVLLVCLLPWSAYKAGQSPFVTFFGALGVPGVGSVMNVVVLSAALSSLNSGLYSTGRVLRALSMGGSAPHFLSRMSSQSVPYAGILVTVAIYIVGVVLNYFVPSSVFEIVLNVASLGILSTWGFIVVCQMKFRQAVARGEAEPVTFRMPGAPVTSWLTLAFLIGVLVLMAFDYPNGTWTVASIPVVALILVAGWYGVRRRASTLMRPTIPSVTLTQSVLEDNAG
ncbi:L-asparagine permease [Paraburkholderia caffeinilytica]|uniref:L-asparagine permease n=1 Tax=Paraburkholderia caffeinilytica TaxID=1761016 RepID=A0ABQ1N5X0_9BURK|nr:L-asparagine permease [Paraburkholderia caffeinilytica]GGC55259.1 L-asparagine permease [Paraburkholderia caffeinilytica]CAB3785238.1 L-asparagine permease 2 [Paraburkholderia caffeinilytica]